MRPEVRQLEAQQIPEGNWDAVVAGAGPAGSTCAFWLARAGRRVLLLDKYRFPRSKPCGDLLIPDAIHELQRSGLFDRVQAVAKKMSVIRISSPSRIEFGVEGQYLSLSRSRLDTLLAQGAVEAGAIMAEGDVVEINNGDESPSVTVRDLPYPVKAEYVIVATGASVTLANRSGMISRTEPSAVALRCYVRSPIKLDEVVITYDRRLLPGYAWIMPLSNDVYNVGCGVTADAGADAMHSLKALLKTFMESFPLAKELMSKGERLSPVSGAALRYALEGVNSPVAGRVLATGEVIGTTFPFTGEGIGKAMHSGRLAAEAVNEALDTNNPARLGRYQDDIREQMAPAYVGYSVAQRWLSQPWLNDFMARRIRDSRYLQDQARRVMEETGDPRKLYAPMSILRSFFQ